MSLVGNTTPLASSHRPPTGLRAPAFDVLHLDGRDLTRLPLEERRAALRVLAEDPTIRRSDSLPGTPEQIEEAVRGLRLEGVVAKRL
jgi:bifunctional non-homologous end joining protein LigD